MPNWCFNRVIVTGEEEAIKEFQEAVEHKELGIPFSFNRILPLPEELKGSRSPAFILETAEEVQDYRAKNSDFEGLGVGLPITREEAGKREREYGADNWFDWCVNNWGVKWDLDSDVNLIENIDGLEYHFNTAWCPPDGIFKELVKKFPDVNISWFYDEPGMELAGYLQNDYASFIER